jgi:hypothetical protein
MTLSHISEVLPRALPAPATSLRQLVHVFDEIEERENPDAVLELKELRMTVEGTLAVPGLGAFAPTDWARGQLSLLLGIQWQRWFASASPEEQADEINRRLGRRSMRVRLRTARAEEATTGTAGVLSALVSPTFSPVPDSALARVLARLLEPADPRLATAQVHLTDRTVSYVIRVGEPFHLGSDHHVVGDVWGGLLVRNSGVGFASLVISLHLERLLCKNGMTAPVPGALCLRQTHRGHAQERLFERLTAGLVDVPGKLSAGVRVLVEARTHRVEDPSAELRELLHAARLPARLLPALEAAYQLEPEPTRFGISQAATLASQKLSPEERFELDRAAGRYLTRLN